MACTECGKEGDGDRTRLTLGLAAADGPRAPNAASTGQGSVVTQGLQPSLPSHPLKPRLLLSTPVGPLSLGPAPAPHLWHVKVVVKPPLDPRPEGALGALVDVLHGHGHHVRAAVPHREQLRRLLAGGQVVQGQGRGGAARRLDGFPLLSGFHCRGRVCRGAEAGTSESAGLGSPRDQLSRGRQGSPAPLRPCRGPHPPSSAMGNCARHKPSPVADRGEVLDRMHGLRAKQHACLAVDRAARTTT